MRIFAPYQPLVFPLMCYMYSVMQPRTLIRGFFLLVWLSDIRGNYLLKQKPWQDENFGTGKLKKKRFENNARPQNKNTLRIIIKEKEYWQGKKYFGMNHKSLINMVLVHLHLLVLQAIHRHSFFRLFLLLILLTVLNLIFWFLNYLKNKILKNPPPLSSQPD